MYAVASGGDYWDLRNDLQSKILFNYFFNV